MDISGVMPVEYNTEDWVKHGQELRRPLLVHPSIIEGDTSVIVGGGLSGMVTGFRIAKKNPRRKIVILEGGSSRRSNRYMEKWGLAL